MAEGKCAILMREVFVGARKAGGDIRSPQRKLWVQIGDYD
jgi:hypothetical protein